MKLADVVGDVLTLIYRIQDIKKITWALVIFQVECKKMNKQTRSVRYIVSGPVYTIPFSNENGTKSYRFGLPFTLKRFRNRHQMKTILKTARFENGMKRFSVNA